MESYGKCFNNYHQFLHCEEIDLIIDVHRKQSLWKNCY